MLVIPWWVIPIALALAAWPAFAILGALAAVGAVLGRGGWRRAGAAVAALCALPTAAGTWLALDRARQDRAARAYDAATQATLDAPLEVDGMTLPRGSDVRWTEPSRTHLGSALLPEGTVLLGLPVRFVSRDEAGWSMELSAPHPIGGWSCAAGTVQVDAAGALRQCTLDAPRAWQGWDVPAGTLVTSHAPQLWFLFPDTAEVWSQQIGRALPHTGTIAANPDGTLDFVYFERRAPLVVGGVPLWNTVRWEYASGQAIAVHGTVASPGRYGGQRMDLGWPVRVSPDGTAVTVE